MIDMLDAGAPAVEVMTEYVRACRRLGHPVPEPAGLHAAYTAEDGLDLQALDDDHRTLAEAVAAVEEAVLLQDQARRALAAAWQGAGAEAAADHLARHAEAAGTAVDGLRATVAALSELRNRLWQLIDTKVGAAQDIEARGSRAEWLSASRTVTTGAGDRAGASELVDMQVAPFVANDIALDWVSAMRDTESAIRQAYRDAAAAIAAQAAVVFERPGLSGPTSVAAEVIPTSPAPASVAPAGYVPGSAGSAPAQSPAMPAPPPAAPPVPVDSMAAGAPAAPMPGAASPLGSGVSGMSGLSGLGQSFADVLGGLLGSGGDGLGESLRAAGDLDTDPDDLADDAEPDDLPDPENDEDEADDEDDEDLAEEEPPQDETPSGETAEPAEEDAAVEPVAPVAVPPEPPVPTPVPEPPVDPAVAVPAEPVPADTPCEIAADELPQAGP
ncbi:hypothetical protein CIW51_07185 [Mycolicibacterium sp. P9-22]|nr:hypothetical protein CIW51_07185 [Mycolicibacterium sp. P9-22]